MRLLHLCCVLGCGLGLASGAGAAPRGVPEKYRPAVKKGLAWLVKQQHKDGYWTANGGIYPVPLTALSGMALLAEGSTTRQGKYAANLRRATDWLLAQGQKNGLIGDPNDPAGSGRYMFGHGYGMLFLASVYEQEKDPARRRKLEDVLERAVKFSGIAQTTRGGWGYVTAKDGNDFDEGAVTVVQIHGLRAARHAGIKVPRAVYDKALGYLKKSTTPKGGLVYSLAGGDALSDGRPALTAAALAAAYSRAEYDRDIVKKWIVFSKANVPAPGFRAGYDEFIQYYYAQAVHALGDDTYAKLFPKAQQAERLRWTAYRTSLFDYVVRGQKEDGSWENHIIGPVYITALYLTVLQLDNETVPLYRR